MVTYSNSEKKQASKSTVQNKKTENKSAPNLTGIPDKMKSKFEGISGFSFSDVRVHYSSDRPAQLQALAYTQGNQVYVAPRQERHLEHELGHVVQQKLGLVKPTTKLQDVEVNDDGALEREADMMGKKDLFLDSEKIFNLQTSSPTTNIVQGKLYGDPHDAKTLITKQIELQEKSEDEIADIVKGDNPDSEGAYTTVGFEHEFASFGETMDTLNPLNNLTHVELAESNEKLAFTDLPFKMETDSNNTIELVGAPFIISTTKENPIPNSDDVKGVDDLMKDALKNISGKNLSFDEMKNNFSTVMGLNFEYKRDILIDAHNFNPQAIKTSSDNRIDESEFKNLIIKYGSKGKPTASTQINFATSAFVYDVANDAFPGTPNPSNIEYIEKQLKYWNAIDRIPIGEKSPNLIIFLKELAKNLSQLDAVKHQKELNEKKELLFTPIQDTKEYINSDPNSHLSKDERIRWHIDFGILQKKYASANNTFNESRAKSGWVKDANTFWLKDTLYNFGIGILNKGEWQLVGTVCNALKSDDNFAECRESLEILTKKINKLLDTQSSPVAEQPRISFGGHDPKFLGARQDTFLSLAGKKRPPHFKDKTLHLVEMRDTDNFKEKLDTIKEKSSEKQASTKNLISDLLLKNKSQTCSFTITYDSQKEAIKIRYSGNLRISNTTITIYELSNSKIECNKDNENKEIFNILIEVPSVTYNMALEEDQALQFLRFIDKVLEPFNIKKGMSSSLE